MHSSRIRWRWNLVTACATDTNADKNTQINKTRAASAELSLVWCVGAKVATPSEKLPSVPTTGHGS